MSYWKKYRRLQAAVEKLAHEDIDSSFHETAPILNDDAANNLLSNGDSVPILNDDAANNLLSNGDSVPILNDDAANNLEYYTAEYWVEICQQPQQQ